MSRTINKEFLKNYIFSDNPMAWALEARGFKHSADLLLKALSSAKATRTTVSMSDISLNAQCIKNTCYLYAISIELSLKAAYSRARNNNNSKETETFSHKVSELAGILEADRIIPFDGTDKQLLQIAEIILEWSGRYYKPKQGKVNEIIAAWFEEVPDQPEMLRPRFSADIETAKKLSTLAEKLLARLNISQTHIDQLNFLPF